MKTKALLVSFVLIAGCGINSFAAEAAVNQVSGRLVNEAGTPVENARIEAEGVSKGTSTRWGSNNGFPEKVVSGPDGIFRLSREESFASVQVRVFAEGFAPENVWLDRSEEIQEIVLDEGARVIGKLLKNGEPLSGVEVGIAGQDRSSEVFAGHFETKTDEQGEFEFPHLPPQTGWWFYGVPDSLGELGTLVPKSVRTTGHGVTIDLGELEVSEPLRFQGRIVTRNEEPLPEDLVFSISNDRVWGSMTLSPDENGSFDVAGLSPGQINLYIRHREWRLSPRNRSLEVWDNGRMTGQFEENHPEVVIEIEKGERRNTGTSFGGSLPMPDLPESRPFGGIERMDGSFISVKGTVVDADSGQPIDAFELLPGRQPPVTSRTAGSGSLFDTLVEPFRRDTGVPFNERPWWNEARQETWNEGAFEVDFEILTHPPVFQITAKGYGPYASDPISRSTNLVVRLTKSRGPNGTVVFPDGKPAEGATIAYMAASEQGSLSDDFELRNYAGDGSDYLQSIGTDGKFEFQPRADGLKLFAAHREGWASADSEDFHNGGRMRLRPWARVTGILVDANGKPVPGELLAPNMSGQFQRGMPIINFGVRATSDDQGRFQLDNLPPDELDLIRLVPMTLPGVPGGGGGFTHELQTPLELKPAETLDLGEMTIDSPPPPSVLERVQEKLGL